MTLEVLIVAVLIRPPLFVAHKTVACGKKVGHAIMRPFHRNKPAPAPPEAKPWHRPVRWRPAAEDATTAAPDQPRQ